MWIVPNVVLGLVAAFALAIALILVTHVEDWSRDLSINHAATSDDAPDERLRTIVAPRPPADLAAMVVKAAQSLPRWALVERTDDSAGTGLHFIRTTGLVGYQDDIRVRIEAAGEVSRLSAESRSRIGKGDLGQNPRNLRELLGKVRDLLP